MSLKDINNENISPKILTNEIIAMHFNIDNDDLAENLFEGCIKYFITKQCATLHNTGIEHPQDDAMMSVVRAVAAMFYADAANKDTFVELLKMMPYEVVGIANHVKDAEKVKQ